MSEFTVDTPITLASMLNDVKSKRTMGDHKGTMMDDSVSSWSRTLQQHRHGDKQVSCFSILKFIYIAKIRII